MNTISFERVVKSNECAYKTFCKGFDTFKMMLAPKGYKPNCKRVAHNNANEILFEISIPTDEDKADVLYALFERSMEVQETVSRLYTEMYNLRNEL